MNPLPGERPRRAALAALLLSGLVLLPAPGSGAAPEQAAAPAAPRAAAAAPDCRRPAHAFVPQRVRIPAIGRSARVVQVPRTQDNAVGVVRATSSTKWVMSMDPKTRPAARHGSVLLAGHTWPDGSALGNAMLRDLHRGDRIFLVGKSGTTACYMVSKRASYPVREVPRRKAFRSSGPEQVVIVACSGKRLGPGNWTRRTLWYAVPVFPRKAAAPTAPTSPGGSGGSGGGLFGGLLGGLLGGG